MRAKKPENPNRNPTTDLTRRPASSGAQPDNDKSLRMEPDSESSMINEQKKFSFVPFKKDTGNKPPLGSSGVGPNN